MVDPKIIARRKARRRDTQRLIAGLCIRCGKEPLVPTSRYGEACLTYWRERARKRTGQKPWRKGGDGRPPLVKPSEDAA